MVDKILDKMLKSENQMCPKCGELKKIDEEFDLINSDVCKECSKD